MIGRGSFFSFNVERHPFFSFLEILNGPPPRILEVPHHYTVAGGTGGRSTDEFCTIIPSGAARTPTRGTDDRSTDKFSTIMPSSAARVAVQRMGFAPS